MTFIVLLGLAIMAPLASNQAFILSNLGVLPDAWYYVGSALGLHVGAWHCSRFGAWSKCWHPTSRVALQWIQHLVHIRPPHPILVDHQQTASKERHNNKWIGPKEASQTKCSSSNLQRRACDCPQLELPSEAGLCHQNTNNQAFSTDLISTN